MPVLSDLEPREVFAWFERTCAIPHGSLSRKSNQRLSGRVRPLTRSLACRQDAANNVVIRKGGLRRIRKTRRSSCCRPYRHGLRKGRGLRQGYGNGGLDLFVDGDVIGARGTTLGGDDSIAVAMALAVLDADDIPPARWVRLHGERGRSA